MTTPEQALDLVIEVKRLSESAWYKRMSQFGPEAVPLITERLLMRFHYGVLVRMTLEGRTHRFPPCDLEVNDKDSPNHQLVDDYATWFANR